MFFKLKYDFQMMHFKFLVFEQQRVFLISYS